MAEWEEHTGMFKNCLNSRSQYLSFRFFDPPCCSALFSKPGGDVGYPMGCVGLLIQFSPRKRGVNNRNRRIDHMAHGTKDVKRRHFGPLTAFSINHLD